MFNLNKKLKSANKKSKDQNGTQVKAKKKSNTNVPELICKSFVDGSLVLGYVHDVSNGRLLICLPGIGNYGYVQLNNVSKIYTNLLKSDENKSEMKSLNEIYHKGDMVKCKVLNFSNKRLNLTIEPDQVNASLTYQTVEEDMIISGTVKSREDHGYIIDLGIDELTGFFQTKNSPVDLAIGQTTLFKIVTKKSKRGVTVKLCDTSESLFYDLKVKTQFDSFLPGARLFNCNVDKIGKNGLHLSLNNKITAFVHLNQIPLSKRAGLGKKSIKNFNSSKSFSIGDKIDGTLLFINPYSKIVYLSLLPHLNDSTKPARITKFFLSQDDHDDDADDDAQSHTLKLGKMIENAQVNMVTQKGVYVKIKPSEESTKQIVGFIPKKHLFDSDEATNDQSDDEQEEIVDGKKVKKAKKSFKNFTREELLKRFPLNSTIRAKIFDFSLMEDVVLLSVRASVINSAYLTYDELQLGQLVNCHVKSIDVKTGGVSVKLSDFVQGFVPKIHTGDVPLSENLLKKKFKIGAELKCKIIALNPAEKRCILTAKKTLVKSKLPLIDSFESAQIGMETYGVVVSIQDYGLLLGFMNDLKGLLPRSELSTTNKQTEKQNLKDLYYPGQLIKCRVLELNEAKRQFKLSLIMNQPKDVTQQQNDEPVPVDLDAYEVGDRIESATIVQINEIKSYFRLKLPRTRKNGIIFKDHLSDLTCLNDLLFDYYKKKMCLENLMVINSSDLNPTDTMVKSKSFSTYVLTLKSTLVDYYAAHRGDETVPRSFEDLPATGKNYDYHGWIKKILSNGVIVELPNHLNGFCPLKKINYIDELNSSNLNGLGTGQSVLVRVDNKNDEKKHFATSIKTRHDMLKTSPDNVRFMIDFFKSYLQNVKKIFAHFSSISSSSPPNGGPLPVDLKQFWHKIASKVNVGSVVKVVVKSLNESTRQIECVFLNELEQNGLDKNTNMIGYSFVDEEESIKTDYQPGTQLNALVMAFDPIARVFCLLTDKKRIKIYSKNFDLTFRKNLICKIDQEIKSEVVYMSQWFCIVGLKAHALGRLAFVPLFRNDFTQLNSCKAFNDANSLIKNTHEQIESKIKHKQVLAVSAAVISNAEGSSPDTKTFKKEDKQFSYYHFGKLIKVIVKENSSDNDETMDYLIGVECATNAKKKQILRELATLNEIRTESSVKRKLDDGEDESAVEIVKRKLVLKEKAKKRKADEVNQSNGGSGGDVIEVVANVKKPKLDVNMNGTAPTNVKPSLDKDFMFPWEVNDFDQFNQIINEASNATKQTNGKLTNEDVKEKNKKKNAKAVVDDRKIYENEEQVFDPNREPENSDDYERLIASKPNCSLVWIKYMVFYLQMAEIDKARNVAQQALKTILYREDQERLNVWVALLNLENMYGTQTTLEEVFTKAVQNCDSYKVHCHMAEIYARSSKIQDAEGVFVKMLKKFTKQPETWIKYAIFYYKNSNSESARKLLLRSFNSLDKKDHVDMVNKFAQLEFKYGEIERGITMYDSLLSTYPNRTDIWSVYIDMLTKHEKYDDARNVFNRILQLGLTSKRMKFIFKKYLDFEKQHGTEDSLDRVKELAAKYVEKSSALSATDETKQNGHDLEKNLKKNLNL